MTASPKRQKPIRDKKHRRFVAGLICCTCDRTDVQAAHIREGFNCMGKKPCDSLIVPLCCGCHSEQHRIGEEKFWRNSILAAKVLARYLHINTGDSDRCHIAINKFKELRGF